MRAIPSPTERTVPTSARSVSTSYSSICWRRIEVISSGRIFKASSFEKRDLQVGVAPSSPGPSAPGTSASRLVESSKRLLLLGRRVREVSAKSVEAAADARVDLQRAGFQDEASDQAGVDGARGLDAAARGLLDLLHDRSGLFVRQLVRGCQLDAQDLLLGGDERLVLARDLVELRGPSLLR